MGTRSGDLALEAPEKRSWLSRLFSRQVSQDLVPEPEKEKLMVLDPWGKSVELVQKCKGSLQRKDIDFAEIYYEELKPFYHLLSSVQQEELQPFLLDIREQMAMLRLKNVRKMLKG